MGRALGFLTPFCRSAPPGPSTLTWFPVVGAVIGALVGVVWWSSVHVWPPVVCAALVVGADLGLTGMLHFDGLVDSADGLLAPMQRARRLEVMKDPSTGAFGVGAGAAVLVLRFGALASMRASVVLVVGVWILSRTVMAVVVPILPYAREEGLASCFVGARPWLATIIGLGGSLAALLSWRRWDGLAVFGACLVGAAAPLWLAQRRLGGFTGDVLGAAGVIGETCALLVAAAKW